MKQRSTFSPEAFWLLAIFLLVVVGVAVGVMVLRQPVEAPAASAVQPPSTEWTTAPSEGVKVDLPDVSMRMVPLDEQTDDTTAPPAPEKE